MDIRWIFFDVGSTLVDETEAYDHRVRDMIAGTDIPFSAFDRKRIEFARQGFDGNSEAIRYFGLKKTPWHSEDEIPFTDAPETLEVLKDRGYHLGILANQVPGTSQRLEAWGLLRYFDVVAASAELGVAKPDRLIFEKALELAGCPPKNAVMVGDRLDNDIFPAKALGMKTVWIRKGLSACQPIDLGKNAADWVIDALSELKEIFKGDFMNKQEIYNYLTSKNIRHEITEHPAVYNMAELAQVEIPYPEADAKNLFVRDDKRRNYYLITVKGDKRVNLKDFKRAHGTRSLTFASAEELADIMGLIPGAVTPLGLLNDKDRKVTLFLDNEFMEKDLIGVHPNDNTATVWLKVTDLIAMIKEHGNEVLVVDIN